MSKVGGGARERLVDAVRRVMHAAGTTVAEDVALDRVAARLDDVLPELGARRLRRVPAPAYEESVGADVHPSAFLNPALPAMEILFQDGRATAQVCLDELHQGPEDSVHGGVISYLMDTLLACVVQQQGHLCVTASLQVDYRRRTPLRRPLDLAARIEEVRPRSVRVSGEIRYDGVVTAQATAVFVAVASR